MEESGVEQMLMKGTELLLRYGDFMLTLKSESGLLIHKKVNSGEHS